AHREGSKAGAWSPASRADQLIEDGMEHRGVCRQSEWFFAIPREANDRPGPRRRIARIAREVAPHDRATLFGQMFGKRPVDADEAVPDELLDLRVAQRMRLRVVRHGCLAVVGPRRRWLRGASTARLFRSWPQRSRTAEMQPVLPVAGCQRPSRKTEAMLRDEIIMAAAGYSFQAADQ